MYDCRFSRNKYPADRILNHVISIERRSRRSSTLLGTAIDALQQYKERDQ